MNKSISVQYQVQDQTEPHDIRISYQIESRGTVKCISCVVNPLVGDSAHHWLKLRQFEAEAAPQGRSGYALLYNDRNHQENLDTCLFIDQACRDILAQEQVAMIPLSKQ